HPGLACGAENRRESRRRGLAKNHSHIAVGIAADVGLISPLAASAIHRTLLDEGGDAARIAIEIDIVVINQRFAKGSARSMTEPNVAIIPKGIALGPAVKCINRNGCARLRGS